MEAGTMRNTAYLYVEESTFDRIDSPQYLNFDCISEAKDSYFEHKAEEPVRQRNSEKLKKLPIDLKDEFIMPVKEEIHDPPVENNNKENSEPPDDFSDDLIEGVKTLQVNQVFAMNPKDIVTSTPFRVPNGEPMPWRSYAKPEIKHCTRTRPFSFEERNKQIMQRKARRIQTLLQAEKEARKFRANPVPKFLKKITEKGNSVAQQTLNAEKKNKSTETGLAPTRFKAKSPKVLRRPAFQPILPRQPLPFPQPFTLCSELRAKDRLIFDNYVKEKERLDERLRELRAAAQKRREEEELIKMRKEMVFKAQPIRKFRCASAQVVKRPLTEPMTPEVMKRQRR